MLAYFCYPETSKRQTDCSEVLPDANTVITEGLSVDEAFTLFQDGYGVQKSKKMRREKIDMQKTYRKASIAEDVSRTPPDISKQEQVYIEKS